MGQHGSGLKMLRSRARRFYLDQIDSRRVAQGPKPSPLEVTMLNSQEAYLQHAARMQEEYKKRQEIDDSLVQDAPKFATRGYCFVCARWTRMRSSHAYSVVVDGREQLNWREQLRCPLCEMINRTRASLHLLAMKAAPDVNAKIYLTEQTTPIHGYLRRHYPHTVGSEFLADGTPRGQTDAGGIRNEDMTALTFADGQFDVILSYEVLEHVPDYQKAFAECARILRPGGKMLFSTPFDPNSAHNIIRARLSADGDLEHILPPEYHGDPLSVEGCLCFQYFGWEMLDQLKAAGFKSVSAMLYWSRDYGYIGGEHIQFLAEK